MKQKVINQICLHMRQQILDNNIHPLHTQHTFSPPSFPFWGESVYTAASGPTRTLYTKQLARDSCWIKFSHEFPDWAFLIHAAAFLSEHRKQENTLQPKRDMQTQTSVLWRCSSGDDGWEPDFFTASGSCSHAGSSIESYVGWNPSGLCCHGKILADELSRCDETELLYSPSTAAGNKLLIQLYLHSILWKFLSSLTL